jgi:hypothetical protein
MVSERADGAVGAPSSPPSRAPGGRGSRRVRDGALLAGAALLTVLCVRGLQERPLETGAFLIVALGAAALWLVAPRLRMQRAQEVFTGLVLLLPFTALLGPSFAPPTLPQAFAFRVVLVLTGSALLAWLLLRPRREATHFGGWDLVLPLAIWYGWLSIALLWAPDKAEGMRYMLVLATMLAVVAAAAAVGTGGRRRIVAFGATMALAYGLIAAVSVLESTLGYRLPTSRLLTATTSQTYAVTSVFHNQNDLATYLAICWPFLLCAFFFTRRLGPLALCGAFLLFGASAFVRTGSRSSLLAVGIESLLALILLVVAGRRLTTRTGKVLGVAVAALLLVAAGYLLFNDSSNPMLRQFRLEALIGNVSANRGSGQIRTSLTERGLTIAGATYLLGAGPGQAEVLIGSGTDAAGIANLHNWWLETYADGGVVGAGAQLFFYGTLLVLLWPILRRDPDPLLRYLATSCFLALAGFVIGALGPSSSLSFVPMWILYGLSVAVVVLARRRLGSQGPPPVRADGAEAR